MSEFWRPARLGRAAALWARCDNCHWSGPRERFTLWGNNQLFITICDHAWCEGDNEFIRSLRLNGWQLTDGHPTEAA